MSVKASQLYQSYNLSSFFPLEMAKVEKFSPNLKLHYLIFLQYLKVFQRFESDGDWLKKYADYVTIKEPKSKLTPLHLSVIVGDKDTAQLLLKDPRVSVAEQDLRQWTPLHHAALLEDPEMMVMLLEADKAKNCCSAALRNDNNGTYQDLRRMAFPQEIHPNLEVFKYKNDKGEIVEGKLGKFQQMTASRFTRQMCASPAFFIQEWVNPTVEEGDKKRAETLMEEYQNYQQRPSLLYLDKSKAGYGVFALERIPEDTIIIDYLGEMVTLASSKSLYAIGSCDGARKRNLGPMINDGFPNCVDFPMANIGGFPSICVLRTTRQVEAQEEILWNYGLTHPVKEEIYFNLAGFQSDQWFINPSLFNRYQVLVNIVRRLDQKGERLNFRKHVTYFHYLFSTPSYQILMLLKRAIDIHQLSSIIKHEYLVQKEGELLIREEVEKNLYIVRRIFNLCERLGKPRKKEKNLVTLVEELFSIFKTSRVIKFLQMSFYKEPYPPSVIAVMQGNTTNKEMVFAMVRGLTM